MQSYYIPTHYIRGWSSGAKVLGKLSVLGRPTSLDYSRARAYCACSRCGWGCLDILSLIYLFSFLSPSLWETARYRLKYCLKGPLNPKQSTHYIQSYCIVLTVYYNSVRVHCTCSVNIKSCLSLCNSLTHIDATQKQSTIGRKTPL